MADIFAKAEGLEGSLKALQAPLLKAEAQDTEIPAQVRTSIIACERSLRMLEQATLRYGSMDLPNSVNDRLRLFRKRALYPFRRETLQDLKSTLEGLQMNLDSAVNVLNL